jgi:hypothetical protein
MSTIPAFGRQRQEDGKFEANELPGVHGEFQPEMHNESLSQKTKIMRAKHLRWQLKVICYVFEISLEVQESSELQCTRGNPEV